MQINFLTKDSNKTLDQVKQAQIDKLDVICNQTILGNFPFVVNGVTYYFPNDDTAQKNFDKFLLAFDKGYASTPVNFTCYDASGNVCRLPFDDTTFPDLYKAHLSHIASNVEKFRDTLEIRINQATTVGDVLAVTWDSV